MKEVKSKNMWNLEYLYVQGTSSNWLMDDILLLVCECVEFEILVPCKVENNNKNRQTTKKSVYCQLKNLESQIIPQTCLDIPSLTLMTSWVTQGHLIVFQCYS